MGDAIQRFAVAQALYKALAREVKTGDPDNLRGQVDGMLIEDYESKGTDRFRLKVNGEEVGTVSLKMAKSTVRIIVEDEASFMAWLVSDGIDSLERFIRSPKGQVLADFMATSMVVDGELPPGCIHYVEPARADGTVVRGCEVEKVASALGLNLPQAAVYALTGEVQDG